MNDDPSQWSLDDATNHTLALVIGLRALRPHTWGTVFAHALREHFDTIIGWKKYGVNVYTTKGRASLPHSIMARQSASVRRHREHVVPMKVLVEHAMQAEGLDEMRSVVGAYSLSIITEKEHALLSHAYPNARESMPAGWQLGDDCPSSDCLRQMAF